MACVVIAGAIAVGKTGVALLLADRRGAEIVRVRDALTEIVGIPSMDRRALQLEGADLDRRTKGRWLADYVLERMETSDELVVDSVRTELQCLPVLRYVPNAIVFYLEASLTVRRARFYAAAEFDPVKKSMSFSQAMQHETERDVTRLRGLAEAVIETDELSVEQVVDEIQSHLRRRP